MTRLRKMMLEELQRRNYGTVESKQLDWHCMARSRSEPAVTRNQWSVQFFGKRDVCRVICRQVGSDGVHIEVDDAVAADLLEAHPTLAWVMLVTATPASCSEN